MQTTHEDRAVEAIGGTIVDACSKTGARQGEVLLRPVPGAVPKRGEPTGRGGSVIAAGSHGEHRMVAPSMVHDGNLVHLAEGGVMVHTDLPDARHDGVRFGPGVYSLEFLREVSSAGLVVEVRD